MARDAALKSKTNKERYRWYKDRGICVKCGQAWNEPGHTTCKACYAKENACRRKLDPTGGRHATLSKDRRTKLIAAGLCTECGKRPASEGMRMCPRCRAMRNDSTRKYKIRQRSKPGAKKPDYRRRERTTTSIKPILFNPEMARAILDGKKTQTRRIVKPAPAGLTCEDGSPARTPPFIPGDILWVRETWNTTDACGLFPPWPDTGEHFMYLADGIGTDAADAAKWKPSIHMPKRAARIFLLVKDVRKERLQDITPAEVEAEGTDMDAWYEYDEWQHQVGDGFVADGTPVTFETLRGFFGHTVWDHTMRNLEQYKEFGWDANPWVWVVEFERTEKPEAWP